MHVFYDGTLKEKPAPKLSGLDRAGQEENSQRLNLKSIKKLIRHDFITNPPFIAAPSEMHFDAVQMRFGFTLSLFRKT